MILAGKYFLPYSQPIVWCVLLNDIFHEYLCGLFRRVASYKPNVELGYESSSILLSTAACKFSKCSAVQQNLLHSLNLLLHRGVEKKLNISKCSQFYGIKNELKDIEKFTKIATPKLRKLAKCLKMSKLDQKYLDATYLFHPRAIGSGQRGQGRKIRYFCALQHRLKDILSQYIVTKDYITLWAFGWKSSSQAI